MNFRVYISHFVKGSSRKKLEIKCGIKMNKEGYIDPKTNPKVIFIPITKFMFLKN